MRGKHNSSRVKRKSIWGNGKSIRVNGKSIRVKRKSIYGNGKPI
jgi:hypothetical protein